MSDPAAPWWAEVQHLRPREDRVDETPVPAAPPAPAPAPTGRFRRSGVEELDSAVATLEHEVVPWTPQDERPPWIDEPAEPSPWDEIASWDEPAEPVADEPRSTLWDDSLEQAFASTPSWADEDDERLLPKGANRIENGRRTIEIRGQVDRIHGFTAPAETKAATRSGRRPARRPSERFERRPDRVALWAFLLGVLLICIAAFSKPGDADASVRAVAEATPAAQVATVAADGTLARR
jgi:hypothetical protein